MKAPGFKSIVGLVTIYHTFVLLGEGRKKKKWKNQIRSPGISKSEILQQSHSPNDFLRGSRAALLAIWFYCGIKRTARFQKGKKKTSSVQRR
jgi:hypothetical protein